MLRRELQEDHGPQYGVTLALLAGWDPASATSMGLELTRWGVMTMNRKFASTAVVLFVALLITSVVMLVDSKPDSNNTAAGRAANTPAEPDPSTTTTIAADGDETADAGPSPEEPASDGAGDAVGTPAPPVDDPAPSARPGLLVAVIAAPGERVALELFLVSSPELMLDDNHLLHEVFGPRADGSVGLIERFQQTLRPLARQAAVTGSHRFAGLAAPRCAIPDNVHGPQ